MRRFVIVTQDTSGLGWAKKLQEEGEQVVLMKGSAKDPADAETLDRVGRGLVEIEQLDKEGVQACIGPETYWIFDRNVYPGLADELRAQGQRVLGTSAFCERMENDRAYAVDMAAQCGLPSPPTHEFATIEEGVAFLEEHPDLAYVMKPNAAEESFSTFVPFREDPADANHELLCYLRNCPQPEQGYILQERKPGVEVNVEVWFHEGRPFFAFASLENKRKWNHDLGEMSGCAGDIVFRVPLDGPLVQRTVGKMINFYSSQRYTGFADVNVIIGDNQTWFLEVCNRFGYNAHPNLFLTCALDGFGNIVADWMDGRIATIPERFRAGFGASITCFIDHKRAGLPIYLNPRHAAAFYAFDGYRPGADLLMTGYGQEIGILTDHDYTIEDAAEGCLNKLMFSEAVSYPDICFRTDLHKTDYRGAPIKRYAALKAMGLL